MIAYLEGTLLKKRDDRIILLANQVGYEVLLPAVIRASMDQMGEGEPVALHIYYHQTERQPKPVLIGFHAEEEKEFFQLLISVEAIGPLKAAQAMTISAGEFAAAIESRDVATLKKLNGIGLRTAQKMIATLEGKVDRFIVGDLPAHDRSGGGVPGADWTEPTQTVLVEQLGYKPAEARQMIQAALSRNHDITTPEALLDEVFKQS